ncbi:MAG: 3'(2'),5'-bisphosphate nucleotidase CysQ, partial [Bacteroidetes bacterium]|nr:3'(2'),5'-bisphosphate nucleotidase CysQ [Bacteroidota bacterium]
MIEIQKIIEIAIDAGTMIIEIYNSDDFNVEIKSDNSPLTRADLAAHNLIKEKLISLYPS